MNQPAVYLACIIKGEAFMGKRQHLSASTISLIVIGALLALVILAGAFLAIRVGAMKTIYPNVYVAGINVGGMPGVDDPTGRVCRRSRRRNPYRHPTRVHSRRSCRL